MANSGDNELAVDNWCTVKLTRQEPYVLGGLRLVGERCSGPW